MDDAASPVRIVGVGTVSRLRDGTAKISQLRAEKTEGLSVVAPRPLSPVHLGQIDPQTGGSSRV
jgi:hypothetical protein